MKEIHYDAEGDILSVTFAETREQAHTGIELSDNIVLYNNPETQQPLKLILLSYQAMVQASKRNSLLLDGLIDAPTKVQNTVMNLLQHAPLATFFQLVDGRDKTRPTSRLQEIFTPATLQMVAAD